MRRYLRLDIVVVVVVIIFVVVVVVVVPVHESILPPAKREPLVSPDSSSLVTLCGEENEMTRAQRRRSPLRVSSYYI